MLLLASILSFSAAFACLHYERRAEFWYLHRWLLTLCGFFVALALVCAAFWAWQVVP